MLGRGGDQVVNVLADPTIRVRIPLTPSVYSVKFVTSLKNNAGLW